MPNLNITHLSFSSCSLLIKSPYLWHKKYVDKYNIDTPSLALSLGKAVHKYLEVVEDKGEEKAFEEAEKELDELIPLDKYDEGLKKLKVVVGFIDDEGLDVGEIIGREVHIEEPITIGKYTFDIPLKGYIDVLSQDENGDYVINDYKVVAQYRNVNEPSYILQSVFYYFLVLAKYGKRVKKSVYWQIKHTKNRDGSPQIRKLEIEIDKKEYRQAFVYMYKSIHKQLNGEHVFIPNFFDMMLGKKTWQFFIEDIKNGNIE